MRPVKKIVCVNGQDSEGFVDIADSEYRALASQVFEYILSNPSMFPGKHNFTQERTSDGLTVLDPVRQLLLIWKGLGLLLRDALEEGRGIHIKHFGTFTFEPIVSSDGNDRNSHAMRIHLRPCFIPANELVSHLKSQCSKEQLGHHIQGSVYQQGIRVSYLNPGPVAQGAYYKPDFVKEALDTLFQGILDLVHRGFNLDLGFDPAVQVRIIDRALTVTFSPTLKDTVQSIEKSYPRKSVNGPLSALTPTELDGNISRVYALRHHKRPSRLTHLERPDSSSLKNVKDRIDKLSESSKDMCNIRVN